MSSGACPVMSWSAKSILPPAGATTPAMARKSEDFPAPFGPVMKRISPSVSEKLTPRTAVSRP